MSIALEQVSKHYGGTPAISDVTVEIAEGELFVLLGPSGSGKSTLLRAIAGLTTIDHGRIVLHGRDVSNVRARDRETGFVFQSYALFRHMTIADNIEFALRARRMRAAERRRRRAELLKLVALEGMDQRLPAELSGGQQQRVAVARALAHPPRVLLLDAPVGAREAQIRGELRRGIRDIQRAVGITTVLVTHDQEEAFTMADRLGVMDRGRLQEVGEPRALYARPRTRFVATFLGAANLLLAQRDGRGVHVGHSVIADGLSRFPGFAGEATVVIRPEDIVIGREGVRLPEHTIAMARVVELEFTGSLERVRLSVGTMRNLQSAATPDAPEFTVEAARSSQDSATAPLAIGQAVVIGAKRVHVMPTRIGSLRLVADDAAGEERLRRSTLVSELAERMRVSPSVHRRRPGDDIPALGGLPIVAAAGGKDLAGAVSLLQAGATQALALGAGERAAQRLLIYMQPSRAARDGALSVAGTLLRHLDVDATLLVPADERAMYGRRYRDLLDLRDAALRVYGVDVRTESFRGDVQDALASRLQGVSPVLLLVGITSVSSGSALVAGLEDLLSREACAGVVLTRARSDPARRSYLPALRPSRLARAS